MPCLREIREQGIGLSSSLHLRSIMVRAEVGGRAKERDSWPGSRRRRSRSRRARCSGLHVDRRPLDLIGCHRDIRSLFRQGSLPAARSMAVVSRFRSRMIH